MRVSFIAILSGILAIGCGSSESRTEPVPNVPDASDESECVTGNKECQDKNLRTCVDGHWQSQACQFGCESGNCVGECKPGQKRCEGLVPQSCDEKSQWQDLAACPYLCTNGTCTGVCGPGTLKCDGNTPQSCSAEGQWSSGEPCMHQVCLDGTCQGVCGPGDVRCDGNTGQTCSAAGQWQNGTVCPFVCADGNCIGVCIPGSKQCNGDIPQTCDAQGTWLNAPECPFTCQDGECTGSCTSGAVRCNNLIPETCDGNGTWKGGTPCQYICANGACTGECVPLSKDCLGNVPRECDSNGAWQAKPACQFACQDGACSGECVPGTKQCEGNTAKSCNPAGFWTQTTCSGAQSTCCNGSCVGGVASVSTGRFNTCALMLDGTVWCWGRSDSGTIGDGNLGGISCNTAPEKCRPTPSQVTALGTATKQISVGGNHACAVKNDGTLWCWGAKGMLGEGNNPPSDAVVQVTALGSDVASVAAAEDSVCALKKDGSVWCWGSNNWGQLGNDSFGYFFYPSPLQAMPSGATQISARFWHVCALKNDGTLWCWGYGRYGALGTLNLTSCHTYDLCAYSPIQVNNAGSGISQVATGSNHTCIRKTDGTQWCWGLNNSGELGDGTIGGPACGGMCRTTPAQTMALGNTVVSTGLGERYTCSLKADGSAWCSGVNYNGELGNGSNTGQNCPNNFICIPTLGAVQDSGLAKMEVGVHHTCAVKNDGSLWCWGLNDYGQLGDGSMTNRYAPTRAMCY